MLRIETIVLNEIRLEFKDGPSKGIINIYNFSWKQLKILYGIA